MNDIEAFMETYVWEILSYFEIQNNFPKFRYLSYYTLYIIILSFKVGSKCIRVQAMRTSLISVFKEEDQCGIVGI